ncbi:thiamine pyrophosphate-dependent enzyme [Saprospiraceae bacterium]|nr:thiamine pyrophosphate-dependent enzyme [Saprospiraceae bacterium]
MIANPLVSGTAKKNKSKKDQYIEEVLHDFWICLVSREASLMGRKEVLTGKAKFGILGDGKEVPQVAMARAFKKGDFRTGYYRDQTFMLAAELLTVEAFFAQLYADSANDPHSGGRQMNAHFATPLIDGQGKWTMHTELKNVSSDISCTAGQMARGFGLAVASKKYRELQNDPEQQFSVDGNEVVFVTIGDASTSEGVFWETMNAAAVSKVPMAVSVWDDGYGISVPKKYQTVKSSISKALEGMLIDENGEGIYIVTVKGYDYPDLVSAYDRVVKKVREEHVPALIHVQDLTQPQGHSTSGSHERYKSQDRLQWERDHDCINIMEQWMIENKLATSEIVAEMRIKAKEYVKTCSKNAWENYQNPFKEQLEELKTIVANLATKRSDLSAAIADFNKEVSMLRTVDMGEMTKLSKSIIYATTHNAEGLDQLISFVQEMREDAHDKYHTHLYSENADSSLRVPVVHPEYADEPVKKTGYDILNKFFDQLLEKNNKVVAFGEDVGHIGDVNQGFAGLQDKYGKERVFDTGIREWTIMGQAIGLAQRGFRPIAEIQYLDYIVYGLEPLVDDLTTLRYRSNGIQMAPAIIRTRGHRLEGIWHAGSPMGMLVHALRGMHIIVPRNMVQAAGFYNTLMNSTDPALVVECLNGYRLREEEPSNLGEYTIPLGSPDVLQQGEDITLVTYGSMVRIAEKAIEKLTNVDISVELIDVQTLLPFDLEGSISESLKKTNKVIFLDEDVPGGATSFMMQEVLEKQGAYKFLDAKPMTITAHEHRTPFGSDGDYFTKPNEEDIFEGAYKLMHEYDPTSYPFQF